jgi:integrase
VQSIGPARFVSDITAEEIGAYLREVRGSAKTRWHHHVTTRMLFGYAERHGYVEKSPMRHVPPPKISNPLPQVFTPEETARFLLAVADTAPRQLAYYILSFFCGIRQSELLRLTWAAVDLHDGYLYLPAKLTKTCAGRLVKLSPCTLEWLKLCSEREGRIYPGDKKTLGKKKKALMQKAGMIRWLRNGARHSFVSYHYALSENAYETASQAGHDVAMLIRHYRAIVPRAEAVKYWAIFPPSLDRRIIPLTPDSSAKQADSLALGRTYP